MELHSCLKLLKSHQWAVGWHHTGSTSTLGCFSSVLLLEILGQQICCLLHLEHKIQWICLKKPQRETGQIQCGQCGHERTSLSLSKKDMIFFLTYFFCGTVTDHFPSLHEATQHSSSGTCPGICCHLLCKDCKMWAFIAHVLTTSQLLILLFNITIKMVTVQLKNYLEVGLTFSGVFDWNAPWAPFWQSDLWNP